MGKGGQSVVTRNADPEQPLKWEEIRKHNTDKDAWLVLEGKVYDVTEFKQRHPGGWRVMEDHAGQDSTVSLRSSCVAPLLFDHT